MHVLMLHQIFTEKFSQMAKKLQKQQNFPLRNFPHMIIIKIATLQTEQFI